MERYILARLLVGGFILFLIIFLVIRIATGRDPDPDTPIVTEETTQIDLPDLATSSTSSVQLIKDGQINALEDHRQIRFTISSEKRIVEIVQGYNGEVLQRISLPNTQNSYTSFMYALDFEGYTLEKTSEDGEEIPAQEESLGVCNQGTRYYFRVRTGSLTRQELWSTSCGSKYGNFDGDRGSIVRLFEDQIPDYHDFERSAKIGYRL